MQHPMKTEETKEEREEKREGKEKIDTKQEEQGDEPEGLYLSARSRSSVWKVFRKSTTRTKEVYCKLCHTWCPYTHGNTSNLLSHIQHHHPNVAQQPTIENFLFSAQKQEDLHRQVARFMLMDMRPCTEAEGEGFRQMLQALQPGYKPASAKTYTSYCDVWVMAMRKKVRSYLFILFYLYDFVLLVFFLYNHSLSFN